jgi:transmembrane sensor
LRVSFTLTDIIEMPKDPIYDWMLADLEGTISLEDKQSLDRLLAADISLMGEYQDLQREFLLYQVSETPEVLSRNVFLSSRLRLFRYNRTAFLQTETTEPEETAIPDAAGLPELSVSRSYTWWQPARVAASIIFGLMLLGGGFLWFRLESTNPPPVAVMKPLLEQVNRPGNRAVIRLTDGSTVTLGVNSRLRYPETFSGNTREVFLTGEAFFEVSPDAAKPFLVHTPELVTQVLGTSFNIKAYPDQARDYITVATGRVQVRGEKNSDTFPARVLQPRQQLVLQKDNQQVTVSEVDPEAIMAWRKGYVIFERASLPDMLSTLRNWYEVDIKTENMQDFKCTFHATLRQEPLPYLLKKLQFSSQFTYKIQGRQVMITGRKCP